VASIARNSAIQLLLHPFGPPSTHLGPRETGYFLDEPINTRLDGDGDWKASRNRPVPSRSELRTHDRIVVHAAKRCSGGRPSRLSRRAS